MTSDMNTGNGMGMGRGMGMGMGRGMGMGMGTGMGMGMGTGMGMGMGTGMGMGMGSDSNVGEIPVGADGGIGFIRSYYATPIELALLPWALNFTPDNAGNPSFPLDYIISPYQPGKPLLEWTTQDWDPALRFWTLPFNKHLTEWLRAADRSEPGTLAALEFAGEADKWNPLVGFDPEPGFGGAGWLEPDDLTWRPAGSSQAQKDAAFSIIKGELETLKHYMEDDRQSYLVESDIQADGLPDYLVHFLGINSFDHPYTLQLIDIGLAMGNVAYMSYKAHYKRVRPSILRPGLTVPFGPPAHPAFPSGHSFLAHFISLLLCEIPGIAARYGVQPDDTNKGDGHVLRKPVRDDLTGRKQINSPIFTIAQRIAVNRERIGVHYPSDSYASRHLAAAIWELLMKPVGDPVRIDCPTLDTIISHATSEWPDSWFTPVAP